MRTFRWTLLVPLLVVPGCSETVAPAPKPEVKEASRQDLIDRPTPLREEVDQVAEVRDSMRVPDR